MVSILITKQFKDIKIGDKVNFFKTITEADVLLFAAVSGDFYPLHVDKEYAKKTRFVRRVVHGILTAGVISAVNGLLLGKGGGISVSQALKFKAPVYIGDTITATAEVIEKEGDRSTFKFKTICTNQRGEVVIEGEAVEKKEEF